MWNRELRFYLINNYETMSDKELAEKIREFTGKDITFWAITKQRQRMGLKKSKVGRPLRNKDGGRNTQSE